MEGGVQGECRHFMHLKNKEYVVFCSSKDLQALCRGDGDSIFQMKEKVQRGGKVTL